MIDSNFLAHLQAKFGVRRRSEDLPRPARGQRSRKRRRRRARRSRTTAYPRARPRVRRDRPELDRARCGEGRRGACGLAAEDVELPARRVAGPASGHPLAVMGPQLGYFYPEIVIQADMHGPGIDAEGVVAPISPYVFIGRGRDFAWSLTSAGSENTQQFLEKLCVPEGGTPTAETHDYEYEGKCEPMALFDAGKLGPGEGEGEREVTFYEIDSRSDQRHRDRGRRTVRGRERPFDARTRAGWRACLQQARLRRSALAGTVLRSGQQTRDDVQHGLCRQQTHRVLLDRAPAGARDRDRPEPADVRQRRRTTGKDS